MQKNIQTVAIIQSLYNKKQMKNINDNDKFQVIKARQPLH